MKHATLVRTAMIAGALFGALRTADAESDGDTLQVPTAPPISHVPDASLRAVKDRVVRLEIDGAPAVEGRVLGFEEASVTIVLSRTNEVVSVPREHLLRVIMVDSSIVQVTPPKPAAPDKLRIVGLQFGLPGALVVDADYKLFHGFASANLLFPILTASGDSRWIAASVGGGVALPITKTSRWKLDVFGEVSPLHVTSFYTYLAAGLGLGFHYTGPSGFTVGFTFPVLGFSTRVGSSPYGYDARFRYNDSLGYYYLAGLVGMPLVTMGYRFATRCPHHK